MATIVTQYNPWREKMAADILGGLAVDALKRSQAADINRKQNAAINEIFQKVNGLGERPETPEENLPVEQAMPEGYDSNGWAKSLHESYSPLTQFDNASASALTAQPQPQIQNRGQDYIPTQKDYYNALFSTLNTPRFNMLANKDMQVLLSPVLQGLESERAGRAAAEQQQRQSEYGRALYNARNREEMGRLLTLGMGSGMLGDKYASSAEKAFEHMYPDYTKQSVDLGNAMLVGGFNPATGETNSRFYSVGQTPNNRADNAVRLRRLAHDINNDTLRNALEQQRIDNDIYRNSLEGQRLDETIRHNQQLEQNTATANYGQLAKQQAERLQKTYDMLKERRQNLLEDMESATDPGVQKKYADEIHQTDILIDGITKRFYSLGNEYLQGNIGNMSDTYTTPLTEGAGESQDEKFSNAMFWVNKHEGGYANNPADKGGVTNLGITQETFDNAKKKGLIKAESIEKLTKPEAEKIYKQEYWDKSSADKLPEDIAVPYFDAVVNHGVTGGAQLLQKAINRFAGANIVKEDGNIGEETISALNSMLTDRRSRLRFIDNMLDVRDERYDGLVNNDPSQGVFLKGWKNRTNDFREMNKILFEHPDGDVITASDLDNLIKATGSEKQVTRSLEQYGYKRIKRDLSPVLDMRPSYMTGNINLSQPQYTPLSSLF